MILRAVSSPRTVAARDTICIAIQSGGENKAARRPRARSLAPEEQPEMTALILLALQPIAGHVDVGARGRVSTSISHSRSPARRCTAWHSKEGPSHRSWRRSNAAPIAAFRRTCLSSPPRRRRCPLKAPKVDRVVRRGAEERHPGFLDASTRCSPVGDRCPDWSLTIVVVVIAGSVGRRAQCNLRPERADARTTRIPKPK